MREYKAPEKYAIYSLDIRLFLGGTIDQGQARDWQAEVVKSFEDVDGLTILNPRRDNWDAGLDHDTSQGSIFEQQIKWEMMAQDQADFKLYNFEPNSKSPVTMLEVGAWADSATTVVVCSPDFWRHGNIKLFCDWRNIPFFEDLEPALKILREEYL